MEKKNWFFNTYVLTSDNNNCYHEVKINGRKQKVCIDTGAAISIMTKQKATKLKANIEKGKNITLNGIGGKIQTKEFAIMEVENEFFKTNIKFMLIDQEVVTLISKVDMEKLGLKLVQETEQKEEYSKFQAVYYADRDKTNLERIGILDKEKIEQKIKNTSLNEEQQKELKELLNKNEDLFSNELKCAGNAIKRAHEIKLTVDKVFQKEDCQEQIH